MPVPPLRVSQQAAAVRQRIAEIAFPGGTSYDHIAPFIGLLQGPTGQVVREELAVLIARRASLNREGVRPTLNHRDVRDQHVPHADDASPFLLLRAQIVNELLPLN